MSYFTLCAKGNRSMVMIDLKDVMDILVIFNQYLNVLNIFQAS